MLHTFMCVHVALPTILAFCNTCLIGSATNKCLILLTPSELVQLIAVIVLSWQIPEVVYSLHLRSQI